jgi:hypothetical protein
MAWLKNLVKALVCRSIFSAARPVLTLSDWARGSFNSSRCFADSWKPAAKK